jgi:NDP-sugar pyrophosphorylase family protein
MIHEILTSEVNTTSISKNASIAESSIIKDPCVIDDGVVIDDFNKIIGPIYIGKNSKIGTGNLVRHSIIGEKTSIGFSCEMARTLMIGESRISHHDVILDSIVGRKCWFGAYVGTTNLLLNNEFVKYKLGETLSSTGLENFGSVIGYNCAIGAGVILLPGRQVLPNSIIPAGTIVAK